MATKSKSTNPIIGFVAPVIAPQGDILKEIFLLQTGSANNDVTYYTCPDKRKFVITAVFKTSDNFITDISGTYVYFGKPSGSIIWKSQPSNDDATTTSTIGINLISNNTFTLLAGDTVALKVHTTDGSGRISYTVIGTEYDQ